MLHHLLKRIITHVAGIMRVGLDTPDIVHIGKQRVMNEQAGLVSKQGLAHVYAHLVSAYLSNWR